MSTDVSVSVHMYTKTGCPFCDKAKAWFAENDIPYTSQELDETERKALYANLAKEANPPPTNGTVPQIVLWDRSEGSVHYIGGYSDLVGSGLKSLFHPNKEKVLPE